MELSACAGTHAPALGTAASCACLSTRRCHKRRTRTCTRARGSKDLVVVVVAVRLRRVVGDLVEQHRHALAVVAATDGLGEHVRDVDLLDLGTARTVGSLRKRVGHNELLQARVGDALQCRSRQDAVRDNGQHALGTVLDELLRGEVERTARVGHVVDEDGHFALDVADEHHARYLVGALALLVEERKVELETVGERGGALGTSGVGRHDDRLVDIHHLADVLQRRRFGIEVVDGHIEEALDLRRMKVHGDHVVAPGVFEHVGDEFGGDGCARLVLLVLSGVEEVRDDGGDALGRGGLAGVDHDEQLHERGVGRGGGARGRGRDARGVDDVDIVLAHRLGDAHDALARLVARHGRLAERLPETLGDELRELGVRGAREHLDAACDGGHVVHEEMPGGRDQSRGRTSCEG
ncbi:hypothetical protein L1887_47731 [Cichorium endivia]|nr:hypothetical protein L1887_47731 [Cichorium endivia]